MADHEIDLPISLAPVGHAEVCGWQTIEQVSTHRVFYQSSPPCTVGHRLLVGAQAERADQGIVPQQKLRTAATLSHVTLAEKLQSRSQKRSL